MPAGIHLLSAKTMAGMPFVGNVICDVRAASAVQRSLQEIEQSGGRVWLDIDHNDSAAAAWVKGFSWSSKGIMCTVEWTSLGEEAIRGKQFYSFSPTFLVDEHSGRIEGLVANHAAGGLCNAPAFGAAMPALVAARQDDTSEGRGDRPFWRVPHEAFEEGDETEQNTLRFRLNFENKHEYVN
jgi:hypothetical protein